MENSGNIKYRFDAKIGGYVAVIARAINGGIDIPPLYNDGKNGEHPVVEIGNEAFALSDAEYVRISESVVKISTDALYAYVALENIFVDENNPVYKSVDGNLYSKDGKKIIRYATAKKDTSFDIPDGVIEIGKNAFSGSRNLISVTIPESVTKIGEWAFSFSGLKTANIPNGVKTIDNCAFNGCKSLEQVYISANVIHIGERPFGGCWSLRSICVDNQNPVYQSKNVRRSLPICIYALKTERLFAILRVQNVREQTTRLTQIRYSMTSYLMSICQRVAYLNTMRKRTITRLSWERRLLPMGKASKFRLFTMMVFMVSDP